MSHYDIYSYSPAFNGKIRYEGYTETEEEAKESIRALSRRYMNFLDNIEMFIYEEDDTSITVATDSCCKCLSWCPAFCKSDKPMLLEKFYYTKGTPL